ncbi:beta-galactosidase-1-like protein 3 [Cylas formicarius]|uniref:beta-galactosidase-1-like protein 3 n=1 Tax=Cylas formicarius TaxID=197179 RepID=UPI00295890F1|nr:beta-galactosidase-1-like protein 3 [Cylas formicarius]
MALLASGNSSVLPTLYEYYTAGGITSGLSADKSYFTLNEKNITLYSGAMHYFRTPKKLWRDRLRKLRAAGLNSVETYVPWNLHEPSPGNFDFGHGGSDMEDFLDIAGFLKTAQEEDLLAIVRPGPYICAEFEFGGFPSWLLSGVNGEVKFRTSQNTYMDAVKRFFNALLPILAALQFVNGGPIVMIQVENEYGSTASDSFQPDQEYLRELRKLFVKNNINSLLVTADGVATFGSSGSLPDYFLLTANFEGGPYDSFQALQRLQPDRPKMAMEFYPGWFDHWAEDHQTRSASTFISNLEQIIQYPGSFNLYMMHGGTSYGFMNGANLNNAATDNSGFQPDTTSYDYDGPLTEAGDYSVKYDLLRDLLVRSANPKTKIPDQPELVPRVAYSAISVEDYIPLKALVDDEAPKFEFERPVAMETLPINNGSGQSYGYIVYRKENVDLKAGSILQIQGHVCDTVLLLVNGKLINPTLKESQDLNGFGFWRQDGSKVTLSDVSLSSATVDLVVENWGRVGYGKLPQYNQRKGLWQGDVLIDGNVITDWILAPLEFKKSWTNQLATWKPVSGYTGPGLYRAYLNVEESPRDTYIDIRNWKKGIVIVNGFVLGRYARIGPQQCLYLPAPLIKAGRNEIVIFEHYEASDEVGFSTDQIYQSL